MKVIEHIKNERTGVVTEVSWGNAITSDMAVVANVASIMERRGEQHPALEEAYGKQTTISITIEL